MDKKRKWIIRRNYGGLRQCWGMWVVGSFLLHQLSNKYNKKDIGLYRDDGLAVFKNKSGPQAERIKKDFQKIFRENDLNIVIKCNLKTVDYLDVTLNLLNNTYKPFFKPNNEINYIHKESNHPPSIIKQVPFAIESRLSSLSSSEKIFSESTPIYQEALKKSGSDYKLKYQRNTSKQPQSNNGKERMLFFKFSYQTLSTTP